MTAPTRRQLMAGSLAAVGAAGAPAIAIASESYGDELAALDDLVDGLPEPFKIMVYLNRIRTFPMEDRRRLVAQFRNHPSGLAEIADYVAEYLGVPS